MALITAIVPIGPNHSQKNLISRWAPTANLFDKELKVILIEDLGTGKNLKNQIKSSKYKIKNSEIITGLFNSPGISRNIGINQTTTPWICFWDADDIPQIANFMEMVRLANDSEADLAIGNYEKFSKDKFVRVKNNYKRLAVSEIAKELGLWRMAFRTATIGTKRFESISVAEDQVFFLDLNLNNKNLYLYEKNVYNYQVFNNLQLTNSNDLNQIVEFINIVSNRLKLKGFSKNRIAPQIVSRILISGLVKCSLKTKLVIVIKYFQIIKLDLKFATLILFFGLKIIMEKFKLFKFTHG
jgi:hypothetical protein